MIGRIKGILGHIGASYVDAQGQMHKGTDLLNLIEQIGALPKETQVIEIPINSPGGYVDVGDSMYDYLVSLKKDGKKIVTIQTGLVGSIATKIFLAGDERMVDDRYEFFIHNPFASEITGDQDQLRQAADQLAETEKNLRKFYATFTGITDTGLDALMKIETGLTADQCLKFGFATKKNPTPVFNSVKPNLKKVEVKKEESFFEHMAAWFNKDKKGVQPKVKAEIPANPTSPASVKSMVVNLADGAGSFWVEGEAVVEGAACFLLDASGQPTAEPLADGDYALQDGSQLSVMGGKISAVMAPASDQTQAEMISKADAEAMVQAAVEQALAPYKQQVEEAKAEILAIKKNTKIGVQPKLPVMAKKEEVNGFKTISQIQKEREQAKRKTN